MKISGSVGKGCCARAADNLVVQTALSNIRDKRGQFYYKGKLDGAKCKELECAIEAFERDHGFACTCRMEACGPKWNRLKEKTPQSVKKKLEKGIVTAASASPLAAMKAAKVASRTSSAILKAALPDNERKSLASVVTELGNQSVPLNLKAISITAGGRFQVEFAIDPSALPTGNEKQRLEQSLKLKISDAMGKSSTWNKGTPTSLVYATKRILKSLESVSRQVLGGRQLAYFKLRTLPSIQIEAELVKGAYGLLRSGQLVMSAGRTERTILLQALKSSNKALAETIDQAPAFDPNNIFAPKWNQILDVVRRLENSSAADAETLRLMIDEFWGLLKECGDPIAQLALDMNAGRGFQASFAALWLKGFIGDKFIKENPFSASPLDSLWPNDSWIAKQFDYVELIFRQIQKDVALMHWKTASNEKDGVHGKLDPRTITDYHHLIFGEFGLPKIAFAGTLVSGDARTVFQRFMARQIWCQECDDYFGEL